MRRSFILLSAVLVPITAWVVAVYAGGNEPVVFEDARMIIEFNSTDQDVGVQIFLDGDPWKSLTVKKPNGKTLLEIDGQSSLQKQGLTELFFESSEPTLDEFSLEDFFDRFPEGQYKFKGKTIEGETIKATAMFTHVIPDAPVIVSPVEDETVDPGDALVIDWNAVPNPVGGEIVAYEIIVESGPLNVLDVKVPASATSLTVPIEFLQPNTAYDFEILAIDAGGNQTITQSSFSTSS